LGLQQRRLRRATESVMPGYSASLEYPRARLGKINEVTQTDV